MQWAQQARGISDPTSPPNPTFYNTPLHVPKEERYRVNMAEAAELAACAVEVWLRSVRQLEWVDGELEGLRTRFESVLVDGLGWRRGGG